MHAVALAIAEERAVGTFARAHPLAVAIWSKAAIPYLPEVICVDISLAIVCADACACRDCSVSEHRAHSNARLTSKEVVSHIALIRTQEALTTILNSYFALLAGIGDILHKFMKLLALKLQLRVCCCTACRKDGKDGKEQYCSAASP